MIVISVPSLVVQKSIARFCSSLDFALTVMVKGILLTDALNGRPVLRTADLYQSIPQLFAINKTAKVDSCS